jgi:hypothetical protein
VLGQDAFALFFSIQLQDEMDGWMERKGGWMDGLAGVDGWGGWIRLIGRDNLLFGTRFFFTLGRQADEI